MVAVKPHLLFRALLKRYIWNMGNKEKTVYLTFDDGPTHDITPKVLEILNKYNAYATFFCIGRNVDRTPEILKEIINRGHYVGNHTYSHLNGLKTKNKQYFEDIELAEKYINSNLFRPPYGLMKKSQGRELIKKFRIIMWDVLSYDFAQNISPQKCYQNVINNIKNGSIVVFHDSEKAWKNLEYALPLTLTYLTEKGYQIKPIIIS